MADRKIRNLTSDYLTCTICWNIFTEPKMLQCGHSYCSLCLVDYVKVIQRQRNCFECPVCRHPHDIPSGSAPENIIQELSNDTVSTSILKALGIQDHVDQEGKSEFANFVVNEDKSTNINDIPVSSFCTCARHPQKPLDVYCAKHDIAVCSECATLSHSGCECSSAANVINKRLNALKCLVAQQASDASRLFECRNSDAKTIKSIHDEFQKSINEVEESFNETYRLFRKRVDSLRTKAKETLDKDMSSFNVRRLQDYLVERVKSIEIESAECDPNKILDLISDLCQSSSEFQIYIHDLAEKISSGALMKYAEGDLNVLDAFVSTVRQTLPSEFLSLDEDFKIDPDDKDFVLVTKSGRFLDFIDDEVDFPEISQQIMFSAKCANEEKCMLSGVALIGNTAVVIADQENKKLKKFKLPEGRFLDELHMDDEPHQVATLRDTNSVAVTFWDVSKIAIVSTDPKLNVSRVLETDTEYIGVTSHTADMIAAASIECRRIDVLDMRVSDEKRPRRRETIFQSSRRRCFPDRLAATSDGSVIVRNRRRHEICCYSRRDLLWSRRLKTKISDITCFSGKVFASLRKRNDIVSFREDGKGKVEYIKPRQPIFHPWALDGFKDCLVVTEDTPSDSVHVLVFA